jgi:hypothetical protein
MHRVCHGDNSAVCGHKNDFGAHPIAVCRNEVKNRTGVFDRVDSKAGDRQGEIDHLELDIEHLRPTCERQNLDRNRRPLIPEVWNWNGDIPRPDPDVCGMISIELYWKSNAGESKSDVSRWRSVATSWKHSSVPEISHPGMRISRLHGESAIAIRKSAVPTRESVVLAGESVIQAGE